MVCLVSRLDRASDKGGRLAPLFFLLKLRYLQLESGEEPLVLLVDFENCFCFSLHVLLAFGARYCLIERVDQKSGFVFVER